MANLDRTNSIVKAVLGFAAAILTCWVQLSDPAAAEARRAFDPVACKSDAQGRYYIALGRYVLTTPYSKRGAYMIDPLRPGDIGFVPPDPSAPEGCPGNPLQSWSYEFVYAPDWSQTEGNASSTGKAPRTDRLTLYRTLRKSPTPSPDDPEWGGAESRVMYWESTCKAAAVREDLPNGLTACRVKLHWPGDPAVEARQENWGASYRARADVYTTTIGRPFVVDCGPLLYDHAIYHCEVAYTLMPGLGIGYRFQPYRGPHPIPMDHIIAFDRGLRSTIEKTIVQNYGWRGEVSIGGQLK
jgi:hypothetical protein